MATDLECGERVVDCFSEGYLYDHSTLQGEEAESISFGIVHLPGRAGVRRKVRFAWFAKNSFQLRMEPVFEVMGSGDYYFASAFASFECEGGKVIPALGRRVLPRVLG